MINYDKNLGTKQKALKINLDSRIYGSFAEIGAGQDVAAIFFKFLQRHKMRKLIGFYFFFYHMI